MSHILLLPNRSIAQAAQVESELKGSVVELSSAHE
ncbi:hypothetical protein DC74_5958 [Streptomyces noursei]|nr:hypothetical protein DC74_5958 [Streptomyces noursei]